MTDPQAPTIAGYTLIRELGRGGMAVVYHATQDSLGREVAIKVMSADLARDPTYAARFLREGRVVANLRHRNILTIHDLGVSDGRPWLAMEFVSGGPVSSEAGHLPPRDVLACVRDIARALEHAHGHGVVHRDIKPENILRGQDGSFLLADFGIARVTEATSALTLEGSTLGTPQYMSPEQWRGEPLDGRSDLYSLGVVMHQLLTGRVPYTGTDGWAIGMQHMSAQVPALPPEYAALQPLLDRMLAKRPDDRFASGGQVAVAAEALAATLPAVPPPRYQSAPTTAMPTPAPTPPPAPPGPPSAAQAPFYAQPPAAGPMYAQPPAAGPMYAAAAHAPTQVRPPAGRGWLIAAMAAVVLVLVGGFVGILWWAASGSEDPVADDVAVASPLAAEAAAAAPITRKAPESAPPLGSGAATRVADARSAEEAEVAAPTGPDLEVQARLERLGITYQVDADHDFEIVMPTGGGRTQAGWLRTAVEEYGEHRVREIWSPAYRSKTKELPGPLANRLLEDANTHKLGGWVRQGPQVMFVVKIPADATDAQLSEALKLAFLSADDMEEELTGDADEF